jgi:hypothetical protein
MKANLRIVLFGIIATLTITQAHAMRWYSASTGKWFSRDPIQERGGLNVYGFCKNDPINRYDKLGKFSLSFFPQSSSNPDPRAGFCGNFVWPIVWQIDPNSDPEKGGIIVQYVATSFHVTDCSGKPLDIKAATGGKVDPAKWPFWEEWRVNKDQNLTTVAPRDDSWQMPEISTCSKGYLTIVGRAGYYDARDDYPSAGFQIDPTSPAGGLPSTRNNPNFGPGDAYVGRTLMATWDCCSGEGRTRVFVTPSTR